MTESGKIVVATVLSVLAHVSLFTVLALMPQSALVQTPAPEPEDQRPLEVTLETTASSQSTSPTAQAETTAPEPELPAINPQAKRTQIDPENLRKTEEAPEDAQAIAAHNSKATSGDPVPPAPASTPTAEKADLSISTGKSAGEFGIDAKADYSKAVGNAIGLRTEFYRKNRSLHLAVGEVKIQFDLDAQGRASNITILSNSAGSANADCARRAVLEAKIPPIPADRLAQAPGGKIRIVYKFITFPSQ